ncbi:MAG: hypothetical protein GWN62_16850 [Aliifodinibius sp.]|nr:hypothetical protein [Fodinibius sp.]
MSVRDYTYFSYCGREFACNSALLVSTIQEAYDTVNWAHERGILFTAESMQIQRELSVYTVYWDDFTIPIVGHIHGRNYPSNWFNTFGIEIPGDYDKFVLTATLRRLERSEFDLLNLPFLPGLGGQPSDVPNPIYGLGRRAIYFEFILTNLNTNSSVQLARIFNNPQYMYNTYPAQFSQAATDFAWDDLTDENMFVFSLLDEIPTTQTSGQIEQYLLTCRVNYKENPSGNPWNGNQVNNGYDVYINQRTHPQTGDTVTADGIIDLQFSAYK